MHQWRDTKWGGGLENLIQIYAVFKKHLKSQSKYRPKVWFGKQIFKQIIPSEKLGWPHNYQIVCITGSKMLRDRVGHFLMIKVYACQEEIILIYICACNRRLTKILETLLIDFIIGHREQYSSSWRFQL